MYNCSPFFILGNPRSGTSLFRLMLNNHPEIVVPPECGFSEWLYDDFCRKEINEKMYRDFLVRVFDSRKFETWGLDFEEVLLSFEKCRPTNYKSLVREIYLGYARKNKNVKAIMGDKNNYYILCVSKIEKIIHGS